MTNQTAMDLGLTAVLIPPGGLGAAQLLSRAWGSFGSNAAGRNPGREIGFSCACLGGRKLSAGGGYGHVRHPHGQKDIELRVFSKLQHHLRVTNPLAVAIL